MTEDLSPIKPSFQSVKKLAGDERPITDFPRNPSRLSRQQLEEHYVTMRKSHVSLKRSKGALDSHNKRYRKQVKEQNKTIEEYIEKYKSIASDKTDQYRFIQGLQRTLEDHEKRNKSFEKLFQELEEVEEGGGFFNVISIGRIMEKIRRLLNTPIKLKG
ncbi:hypothetical protein BO98_00335 [Candidatus Synechococcus spongiarum LMB bulk10D]|nr:hypothetical protein BO98_00335 [Candidatus Synechococcus spongiarum LMB bulk10D]